MQGSILDFSGISDNENETSLSRGLGFFMRVLLCFPLSPFGLIWNNAIVDALRGSLCPWIPRFFVSATLWLFYHSRYNVIVFQDHCRVHIEAARCTLHMYSNSSILWTDTQTDTHQSSKTKITQKRKYRPILSQSRNRFPSNRNHEGLGTRNSFRWKARSRTASLGETQEIQKRLILFGVTFWKATRDQTTLAHGRPRWRRPGLPRYTKTPACCYFSSCRAATIAAGLLHAVIPQPYGCPFPSSAECFRAITPAAFTSAKCLRVITTVASGSVKCFRFTSPLKPASRV